MMQYNMGNSYLPMGKIASVTAPIVFQRTMYLPIKTHKRSSSVSNHGLVQGEYSSKPLKYSIVKRILVVKR